MSSLAPLATPAALSFSATASASFWLAALAAAVSALSWAGAGPAAHRPNATASGMSLRTVTGTSLLPVATATVCSQPSATGGGGAGEGGRAVEPGRLWGRGAQPAQAAN